MNAVAIEPEELLELDKKTLSGQIHIKNISSTRKAFKIKTTKPEDFSVKMSIGSLHPDQLAKVKVVANENVWLTKSHKFAVEIYEISWSQKESTIKTFIKEAKPILVKQLRVACSDDSSCEKNACTEVYGIQEYVILIFIACMAVCLYLKMYQSVDM